MSKQEGKLKSAFGKELARQCPTYITLLYATRGAPDREIVGDGKTTRWEFKHATPSFASPGNQELLCMWLEIEGHCRYVVWEERAGRKQTMVVQPRELHMSRKESRSMVPDIAWPGFAHRQLVAYIKDLHEAR